MDSGLAIGEVNRLRVKFAGIVACEHSGLRPKLCHNEIIAQAARNGASARRIVAPPRAR